MRGGWRVLALQSLFVVHPSAAAFRRSGQQPIDRQHKSRLMTDGGSANTLASAEDAIMSKVTESRSPAPWWGGGSSETLSAALTDAAHHQRWRRTQDRKCEWLP